MKIKNLNETAQKLQPFLIEYLEKKGINTARNFKCINPEHHDDSPSMSIVHPENIRFYCHGCGATGDIFDAVHFLENKPVAGPAFTTETIGYLGKMFNVEVQYTEPTEEEIYELDTYRAYKYAHDYITAWDDRNLPEDIIAEFERRKWTDHEKLRQFGVGFVKDPAAFREYLKGLGFAAGFLDDIDLGRKDIFAPGRLIFTVKDEYGRPVGFAARDLNWIKGKGPKFVNQKTTGVKCNIYQKSKRLYGLDRALKKKSEGPIYIVEGYADVISAHLAGFDRVVATCGTSLTNEHIYLLKELGIYSIILCYDGDEPGQERTQQLLDSKLSHHKDMSIQILTIPDSKDPDDYIREYGIDAFRNLKPWSAFQWRLNRFDEEEDPEFIAKTMMPLIVSEPSHISQEKMLMDLAKYTGFTIKTLQNELNRLVNEKERNKDRERSVILDKLSNELRKSPAEAEVLIAEAQSKLYSLRSKYDEDNFSEEATLRFIADLKQEEEEKNENYQGFVLGPDLAEFQEALTGEWQRDVLMIFGGKANSGKTSFLSKLSIEIAKRPENNAVVIYHTIDDSAEQLLPKLICICEGSTQLEINQVKHPKYYKNRPGYDYMDIKARREEGYNVFMKLVRDGHYVLKDANNGISLGYAEALIKYYQDKYPDRQVVYFLDNFHKLRDFEGLGDERSRFKMMSQVVKGMAVKYHIPVICTMEYTKLQPGVKPTNDNIAETVQMEYDANLIAHLWNGVHDLGDRADERHFHTEIRHGTPVRMPIVELNIGKNKISSFKSKLYFRFFPASSDFREQPLSVQTALEESISNNSRNGARTSATPTALF